MFLKSAKKLVSTKLFLCKEIAFFIKLRKKFAQTVSFKKKKSSIYRSKCKQASS